jgi:PPOX class probable F420-dependent enzyme
MASVDKVSAFLAEPRTVIVGGVRKDGRAHMSPVWFLWDGERFYVSTTRDRVKYGIFRRDPRAQLLVDDSTGSRVALVYGTVEIREDLAAELPRFRAIKQKHGAEPADDETFLAELTAEGRVMFVITPDGPIESWTTIDLD